MYKWGVGFCVFSAALLAGCAPTEVAEPGGVEGRPFDVLQQRLRFPDGDRFDRHVNGRFTQPLRPPAAENKDWNYNLGAGVTSAVAIYNSAYSGGSLTSACSDRMFVATTTGSLFGFDRLYAANPACVNAGSDGGRCNSSYCPHRMWNISLSGAIDRSAVTLSLDGTVVYAATSAGLLYAVDGATGTIDWSFDANADIGAGANAGFAGAAPWVNYTDGSMYIAASYTSSGSSRVRLYRISAAGAKLYSSDFGTNAQPESIQSTVLAWDAIYFGTGGGRVYKVFDSGATFTSAGAPWPVQLSGETRKNGNLAADTTAPIAATPTLDTIAGALFVPVNNVMWSVNTSTGATSSQGYGWNTAGQALTTDVPCYSSPWADLDNHVLFLGHGRFSNAGSQNRLFAISYSAAGALTGVADSVNTRGTASTISLSDPRSSPIFLPTTSPAGNVFMGDAGGFLDKWSWSGTALSGRTTFQTSPSSAISAPVMIDFVAGFLYFGTTNGHVYQITQSNLN